MTTQHTDPSSPPSTEPKAFTPVLVEALRYHTNFELPAEYQPGDQYEITDQPSGMPGQVLLDTCLVLGMVKIVEPSASKKANKKHAAAHAREHPPEAPPPPATE